MFILLIKSTVYVDKEYEVDTQKWTCTFTVSRTGSLGGELCEHQRSVASKYKLTALNLLLYFNGEGRYLHALIALGHNRLGDKDFYAGMNEFQSTGPGATANGPIPTDFHETNPSNDDMDMNIDMDNNREENLDLMDHDEGEENLDLLLGVLKQHETLQGEVLTL